MWFKRMELEIWFNKYQYAIDYDIGESAVKTLAVDPGRLFRHLAEEYKTFVVPGRCFEMDNMHFRIGFVRMRRKSRSALPI